MSKRIMAIGMNWDTSLTKRIVYVGGRTSERGRNRMDREERGRAGYKYGMGWNVVRVACRRKGRGQRMRREQRNRSANMNVWSALWRGD